MSEQLQVAIAGMGSIGRRVAHFVDGHPRLNLAAVATGGRTPLDECLEGLVNAPLVARSDSLAEHAEVVIECAPAAIFPTIAEPVIKRGLQLITLSSGALLDNWHLHDLAQDTGAVIRVPSGAIMGLDAVQAAALGEIHSVKMTTRKPPVGLKSAPYLEQEGILLEPEESQPRLLFSGTAREAIKGFPANLNVAVALALAGIGPDRTELDVWADPNVTRNTHHVVVEADSARLTFTIENVPSENPKTGLITALSVQALLAKMVASFRVGT